MHRILLQRNLVSQAAVITMAACRLLAGYLVGDAVALRSASHSLDKNLKFIAAQDDAFIAEVRRGDYRHRLPSGVCNA